MIREDKEMNLYPTRILLATDGSSEASLAAKTAAGIAARTGSQLHVLTVRPGYPYYELPDYAAQFQGVLEAQKREAREMLGEQVRKIEESGGAVEETHLRIDERSDRAIVDEGERLGVGLIAVGSCGLGPLRRALMGSVSESVVHHAHCPVLVVRDGKRERDYLPGRILLAVDGSEEALAAARMAVELADSVDSELHLVHVGEVTPVYHPERHGYLVRYKEMREAARRLLHEQMDKVESAGGTVARAHLGMGRPDEEIVVLSEEIGAGLIVIGSRGLGQIRRVLMGSVSESVVHHASCPILVVRKEE